MSAKKKYSEGTIARLLNIALQHRELTESDLNTYANNLFEVVQLGCWQKIKDSIIDNPKLTGAGYIRTMMAADEFRVKVKTDIERFKAIPLDKKLKSFRISNFLDVDFTKYKDHEESIKKVLGDRKHNSPREVAFAIEAQESRDYALLTSPVRSRFNKQFEKDIENLNIMVRNEIRALPKKVEQTRVEADQQTNRTKLKI